MNSHNHFVVRLPGPLEQQKLLADIAYRWVRVFYILLLSAVLLLALLGI